MRRKRPTSLPLSSMIRPPVLPWAKRWAVSMRIAARALPVYGLANCSLSVSMVSLNMGLALLAGVRRRVLLGVVLLAELPAAVAADEVRELPQRAEVEQRASAGGTRQDVVGVEHG